MYMPWLVMIIEVLLLTPFHFMIGEFPNDALIVLINVFAVEVFILKQDKKIMLPMLAAFSLRLMAMVYDLSTLSLSHMNGDTIGYYNTAVQWMNGQAPSNVYGLYSQLIGYIFRITGDSRLLVEYLNVLMGISIVWILYKCMCMCAVRKSISGVAVWILSVFPYSIYSSCVTYRETIIAMFVALSVYFALNWYLYQKWSNMFLCFASLAFASAFHAGVVVMSLGYALLFTMYSYRTDRFALNKKSIISLGLFISAFVLIVMVFPEIFFTKLNGISEESIITQVNWNYGGSAYLSWLNPNSLAQVIIASPLKLFYFLFSPLPDNWRGIVDIGTFLIDSMAYIVCVIYLCRNFKTSKYEHFIVSVFLGWLANAFVFGLGTWTAGTAIRHRNKIFMVLLLITAMSTVKKDKESVKE